MVCLTLGFASFLLLLFLTGRQSARWIYRGQRAALLVCWLALTAGLALRWVVTGHVPMANGYETMLFLAWVVMLLAMVASRRFRIMLTFGLLLAGFFLLASHISQMDPKITHLMPVLNSPLLTLHVSIIMMAYALLALTFVSSLTALLMPLCIRRRNRQQANRLSEQMQLLSQLMLYPALACLGFGIFIGAIWANVSWGTYWSWDPKETWALITFMVYAVPAHRSLFTPHATRLTPHSTLHTPHSTLLAYHVYMVLAFLTILMTYFGVNYFLGGMHSYA
jgi:cytochrome c-type biogenesis protein CcsB